MCARDREEEELEDEFAVRIRRQSERIERGRREHGQSFWRYLGLIGTVGWSVVVPMTLGALLGMYIDKKTDTDYQWTLGLLVFGLFIGCLNAWRTITKEQ